MLHNLAKSAGELVRTFSDMLDPYRPELHYMRGPGPKWHAKRAAMLNSDRPEVPIAAAVEARA